MIKTTTKLFTLFALATLSNFNFADHEQGFFVGGNVALVSSDTYAEQNNSDKEVNIPSLELVAGYKYNNWLGLDLRYGNGIASQEEDITDGSVDYSVSSYQSFYYRPEILNKEAKLYFLIGYTSFEASAEATTDDGSGETVVETTFSESGTSYGIGAGWFVGDDLVVNLEYRQLVDTDEETFSVVTFGADYRF
ncbi:MAG: porin family protein [Agarilytica sp.]